MKQTEFTKFIEILKILQKEGFDVKTLKKSKKDKITRNTRYLKLKDIKHDGVDIQDVITKYNLDGNYPYGRMKIRLDMACKGSKRYPITDEELQEGMQFLRKSPNEKLLNILEILKAEGIDITKIKLNKMSNKKELFTTLKDINQDGIDINRIIEANDLEPDYKIGYEILKLRQEYQGNRKYGAISEEEKNHAEELGIVHSEKRTVVSEAIRISKILQAEGIDIDRIKCTFRGKSIKLADIKQEGIDIEDVIRRNGLDANYEYGLYKGVLLDRYRGNGTYAMTEDEKMQVEELFDMKKTDSLETLFNILETLQKEGVNIYQIKKYKYVGDRQISSTLMDIKQDGIDMDSIIRKYELDGDYKIGSRLNTARSMYAENGKEKRQMTEAERKRAEKLGIASRVRQAKKLLDILEILYSEGVDVTKIQQTVKGRPSVLRDIKQDGIDIERILNVHHLDGDYKVGMVITKIRQDYKSKGKNKGKYYCVTEEDKRRAEKLGIVDIESLGLEQAMLQEKLEQAKKLEEEALQTKQIISEEQR